MLVYISAAVVAFSVDFWLPGFRFSSVLRMTLHNYLAGKVLIERVGAT